jgi:hypothetical protein
MKLSETKHPMQPIGLDWYGTARFKANKIVQLLLDNGPTTASPSSSSIVRRALTG